MFGTADHEVGDAEGPRGKFSMIFASPGERRDAVRDAIGDGRRPAYVLEEMPAVSTYALEAVEQFPAREGRAHLD
eukprot:7251857-Heterocapsa_arctica.AAC.1